MPPKASGPQSTISATAPRMASLAKDIKPFAPPALRRPLRIGLLNSRQAPMISLEIPADP